MKTPLKVKNLKKMKNIDVVIFHRITNWLFKHRVKLYVLIFVVVFREVVQRIPYLNILFAGHINVIDAVLIPLIVLFVVGFNGRYAIIFAIFLFLPLAIVTLLNKQDTAEYLSNIIFVLLVLGVLIMIINFLRSKNV